MDFKFFSDQDFSCYALSEKAITLEFGKEINSESAEKVQALYFNLCKNPFPGFHSAVPAYNSLTVFYDPIRVLAATELKGRTAFLLVKEYMTKLWSQIQKDKVGAISQSKAVNDVLDIPTYYGGEYGPDLEEVAAYCHLSPQEIIQTHSEQIYEVSMIGFMPGFTYLSGLPSALSCPRKQSPRSKVPAGSVGIAGSQTGIYSLDTPGGWQIIGRITWTLFDPLRSPAVLLKIGDRIRFVGVDHG